MSYWKANSYLRKREIDNRKKADHSWAIFRSLRWRNVRAFKTIKLLEKAYSAAGKRYLFTKERENG